MQRFFQNILDGMRQVLTLSPDVGYIRPSRRDFHTDVKRLRNDSNNIVRLLRRTAFDYDHKAHNR